MGHKRVSDQRLEELRLSYAYLVQHPGLNRERLLSDQQHWSLITELQRFRRAEGAEIIAPAECPEPGCDDPECLYRHAPLTLRQAYENCLLRLRDAEGSRAPEDIKDATP